MKALSTVLLYTVLAVANFGTFYCVVKSYEKLNPVHVKEVLEEFR